jgi:hypothetical protein
LEAEWQANEQIAIAAELSLETRNDTDEDTLYPLLRQLVDFLASSARNRGQIEQPNAFALEKKVSLL